MKNALYHIASLSCLFFETTQTQSNFNISSYQVGIGNSSLLGDLGGAGGDGSHFIKDFDRESIRFSISPSADWALSNHFEFRTSANFVYLSAEEKYSEEKYRKRRNLSVKTSVFEILPTIKYNFLTANKNSKKRFIKNNFSQIYTTLGIGFIYFNPKAKYNGMSYNLKKLGTEGQGLYDGAKPYSRFSIIIPVTIRFSKDINKKASVFCEFTARKSFTDYLDDVSTVYYDNLSLEYLKGKEAAELADRHTTGYVAIHGQKRGNSNQNDTYFTLVFGYRIILSSFGKRLI